MTPKCIKDIVFLENVDKLRTDDDPMFINLSIEQLLLAAISSYNTIEVGISEVSWVLNNTDWSDIFNEYKESK